MTEVNTAATEATTVETTAEAVETVTTTETTGFVDTLQEELRGSKSLEKFKSVDDLAKSYINLESKLGAKTPGAPEQYIMPEEIGIETKEILEATGKANNMTQEQVNALANKFIETDRVKSESAKVQAEETMAKAQKELEAEFGSALDARLDAVKSILNQYADEDTKTAIKETGLMHDAKFVKFLDKITNDVLKHTAVASDYTESRGTTPAEALAAIEAKKADKTFMEAYMNTKNPGHALAVKEWEALFAAAYTK